MSRFRRFWREFLVLDPASKSSGVVSHQLRGGGELHVDVDALRRSMDLGRGRFPASGQLTRLVSEFENYSPPDRGGNPLSDKEKNTLKALHLDDYQPRDTEHPAFRMFWERSFPTPPPMTLEEVDRRHHGFMGRHDPQAWVHYRNRHPGIRDVALGEVRPMRDAMSDLLLFLAEINEDLERRDLVAVEVGVTHEPAEQVGEERQGWHYRVEALVVPSAVLVTEQRQFQELKAQLAAKAAEKKH